MRAIAQLCLLAVFAFGCVNYDGTAYRRVAAVESTRSDLNGDACMAHVMGEAALSDGPNRAFKGPLGSGRQIDEQAAKHHRQALVCNEAVARGGALTTKQRLLGAWRTLWSAGLVMVGD